jgi:hypothetical protein
MSQDRSADTRRPLSGGLIAFRLTHQAKAPLSAQELGADGRQALEDELERIGPPTDPQLDQAAALLAELHSLRQVVLPRRWKRLIARLNLIWPNTGSIVICRWR